MSYLRSGELTIRNSADVIGFMWKFAPGRQENKFHHGTLPGAHKLQGPGAKASLRASYGKVTISIQFGFFPIGYCCSPVSFPLA